MIILLKLNKDVFVNSWGSSLNSPRRINAPKDTMKRIRKHIDNNDTVIVYDCPKTNQSKRPNMRTLIKYPSGNLYCRMVERNCDLNDIPNI